MVGLQPRLLAKQLSCYRIPDMWHHCIGCNSDAAVSLADALCRAFLNKLHALLCSHEKSNITPAVTDVPLRARQASVLLRVVVTPSFAPSTGPRIPLGR